MELRKANQRASGITEYFILSEWNYGKEASGITEHCFEASGITGIIKIDQNLKN